MTFWNNPDVQLKQKSRFVVSFAGDFFLPNVKTVSKPSLEINNKEFKLINHTFNYPGTVKWNPITITFVDMNGSGEHFDTAGFLSQMLNNSGYAYPHIATHKLGTKGGTEMELSTPEKASMVANAFGPGLSGKADSSASNRKNQNIIISQLTPEGKVNESWTIVNPLIKSIKFGDLAYDSNEAVEYTLEVTYDYAIYN